MPGSTSVARAVPVLEQRVVAERQRPRADEAHLAAQDVDELRQLVEREAAQEPPDARHARVVADLEERARRPRSPPRAPPAASAASATIVRNLSIPNSRSPTPMRRSTIEDRAARVELDRERDQRARAAARRSATSALTTRSNVRLTAQSQPVEDRWAQLEERQPLPRDVLAPLDEELGRLGSELNLDALRGGPARRRRARSARRSRASARISSSGRTCSRTSRQLDDASRGARIPGAGSGATAPTNSYVDPAARGARVAGADRRGSRPRRRARPAGGSPAARHQLERERLVRRAEQRRSRARETTTAVGIRPDGREVVVRAEPEREHDQRDERRAQARIRPAPGRRSRGA